MPIYEYRCDECGKEFEALQKFSDKPLSECIHCGGKVEKLISQSSFHLKGGGWYKDGYTTSSAPSCDSKKGSSDSTPPCGGCPSAS